MALVVRDRQGNVSLKQIPGHELKGDILGVPTASLAGLLGAPAGVAAKAASGTLAELLIDLFNVGVSPHFLNEISKHMVPGKVAVIAEIDEEQVVLVDGCLEQLGGAVFRRARSALEDSLLERDIAVFKAEVASMKAETGLSSWHTKARIQARIDAAEAELQAIQMQAATRAGELKHEAETKIRSVQDQTVGARDEIRTRLERRIAKIREDYEARSSRLNMTEQLARAALAD
jgi:uncharacterized membrane protein